MQSTLRLAIFVLTLSSLAQAVTFESIEGKLSAQVRSLVGYQDGDASYDSDFDLNSNGVINVADSGLMRAYKTIAPEQANTIALKLLHAMYSRIGSDYLENLDFDENGILNVVDAGWLRYYLTKRRVLDLSRFLQLFSAYIRSQIGNPVSDLSLDMDGNGVVNVADAGLVRGYMTLSGETKEAVKQRILSAARLRVGTLYGQVGYLAFFDINSNGAVNVADTGLLAVELSSTP